MHNAVEAIAAWIDAALNAGEVVPPASDLVALRTTYKAPKDWIWGVVEVMPR